MTLFIVSIHAPTRGATNRNKFCCECLKFQSTHPHGVRHGYFVSTRPTNSFNPRTHTGCDLCSVFSAMYRSVSIHAPTRGATEAIRSEVKGFAVSIHAPTRGATSAFCNNARNALFQSTHPHGVRLTAIERRSKPFCFNPRTHTGCDSLPTSHPLLSFVFQSTHPHGVRPFRGCSICISWSFNPRTHTGCDTGSPLRSTATILVSIHAPTRGATER